MQVITAHTESAIDKPYVKPIKLAEITIGSIELYLCDRTFDDGLCTFNGQLYEPFILSWGTIKAGRIDPSSNESEPGEASFSVDNSQPIGGASRFTALFADTDPQYSSIAIYEIYDGATSEADKKPLFVGKIEDILEMPQTRVTLSCAGYELDIANRFDHNIIDTTNYPGADPDDIGKMAPQIYGTVKRSPCRAIDAGGKSTITSAMTWSSPGDGGTLEISDATAFPSSGAFTVQVDSEQVRIASRSGNILQLVASGARGYGTTTPVDHDAGAAIAEIQTEYIYMAADHPLKSIDSVYVDNIRQTTGFTAYTGQTGDEHASYPGKAIIEFSVLPLYQKQINIEIDTQNLGVDSTQRGVSDGGHAHAGETKQVPYSWNGAESIWHDVHDPDYPERLIDENHGGPGTMFLLDGEQVRLYSGVGSYPAPPIQIRYCMATGLLPLGTTVWMHGPTGYGLYAYNQGGTYPNDSYKTLKSSWYGVNSLCDTWAKLANQNFYVEITDAGYGNPPTYDSIWIYEAWLEVRYTETTSEIGYANPALSGANIVTGGVTLSGNSTADTVIGERVSIDCGGYPDDASGTYTGIANALIERPDHICKHIIMNRCGLSADEIDPASYLISGNYYSDYSYVLGFPILQRPNARNLLNRIATQSKSLEFWDAGKHYLRVQGSYSVQKLLDGNRVDQGQVYLKYTDRIHLKNMLTARYGRHWSGYVSDEESDRLVVFSSDAQSISDLGTLQGDPESYPYILNEAQAQAVLDWKKDNSKNARLIVELSGGYYLSDIQLGDVIAFDVINDSTISNALSDLITSDLTGFVVIEKNYRPDASIQLTGISVGLVAATTVAVDALIGLTADNIDLITMDCNIGLSVDNLDLVQKHVIDIHDASISVFGEEVRFSGVEYYLQTEAWDNLLQENGDKLVLESLSSLLTEDGGSLLQENGDLIYKEI